jgi:hypothetical protein
MNLTLFYLIRKLLLLLNLLTHGDEKAIDKEIDRITKN